MSSIVEAKCPEMSSKILKKITSDRILFLLKRGLVIQGFWKFCGILQKSHSLEHFQTCATTRIRVFRILTKISDGAFLQK